MSRKRIGFTLIELLVVIAIIAILAAILFPVFARARAKAQQSACLSNTKELGMACLMYADDWDGWQAYGEQNLGGSISWQCWDYFVSPYVKNTQIYVCPTDPNPTGSASYQYNSSFANNETGDMHPDLGGAGWRQVNFRKVALPAQRMLICEATGTHDFYDVTTLQYIATWHQSGCNMCFTDGHATWMANQAVPMPYGNGTYASTNGMSGPFWIGAPEPCTPGATG